MITDQQAARAGWYYDPLHQQPVYLFWDLTAWRAHFVWHDPLTDTTFDDGGKLSGHNESLTHDMYRRLIPLGKTSVQDYISAGGCAIRELYGMRPSVQVKPSADGRGVFVQAPAVDDRGQCDPSCQVVWLSDDEIPTIIRALQARRRELLEGSDAPEEHDE